MTSGLLTGQTVVVTGAAGGIGRALAVGLAAAGAQVALGDLDDAGAVLSGPSHFSGRLDVTDPARCAQFCAAASARLGPITALVNNAGILRGGRVGTPAFDQSWTPMFRVNVDGAMNMVTAVLAHLRATRGSIVNICSTSAFMSSSGGAAYAATKGAIVQLTRGLAVDLGGDGIRVNAVAPGAVMTAIKDGQPPAPESISAYVARTPLGRMATPDDIVGPVAFLLSNLARHVTGTILPVDGGYLATGILKPE